MDLVSAGVSILPSVIGLLGGGKDSNQPQDVEMKTPPSVAPEQDDQFAQFNTILTQLLSDPNLLKPTTPYNEMDYGPTNLDELGQSARTELSTLTPSYGLLPQEQQAADYLTRMLNGEVGTEARAQADKTDAAAQAVGDRTLAGQTETLRAKYAGGDQLYGAAPMAEMANAAGDMGLGLAADSAQRRSTLENFLLSLQSNAAPMIANLDAQATSRGLGEAGQRTNQLSTQIGASENVAALNSEIARRKQIEMQRQEGLPYDRMSQLASLFGSFRPSGVYAQEQTASPFAQALGASAGMLPGLSDLISSWLGGDNSTTANTGTGNTPGTNGFYDSNGNWIPF